MDAENVGAVVESKKSARERIFAVDRRAWARACDLGMPAAVSYLVLACGTGGDQRTTRWSVDAITRHTGIGRPRAKKAVEALRRECLVEVEKGGTRPRYRLRPGHELEELKLSADERHVLKVIRGGEVWVPKVGRYDNVWKGGNPYKIACQLAHKGFVTPVGAQSFEPVEVTDAPDWIWLPSSLVESENGAVTPVERVRQSQNVGALRLLIDLYHAHDLRDGEGIEWRSPKGLRQQYERVQIGARAEYVVWGFKQKTLSIWRKVDYCRPHLDSDPKNPTGPFWKALEVLTSLHLVDVVPHLVDADSEHGEVMWPISLDAGESFERAVGKAALDAAAAMVTEGQANFAEERGVELIAPVAAHVANVQAIGIHRLRHRPHTEPTLKWFREKAMQCDAVARRYAEMRGKSKTEPAHAADGAVGWTAASGSQCATSR